jgi:hypothetical protein
LSTHRFDKRSAPSERTTRLGLGNEIWTVVGKVSELLVVWKYPLQLSRIAFATVDKLATELSVHEIVGPLTPGGDPLS